MKTLHVGLRVADVGRSVAFYAALGYETVGTVPDTPIGDLVMLKLPDDDFVTVELVHDPRVEAVGSGGLSHLVVQVDSMDAALAPLAERGIEVEGPTSPDGSGELVTSIVVDPDGNRIELVQWPAGHAVGMTARDFA